VSRFRDPVLLIGPNLNLEPDPNLVLSQVNRVNLFYLISLLFLLKKVTNVIVTFSGPELKKILTMNGTGAGGGCPRQGKGRGC